MSYDINKLNFSSEDPIDKIVADNFDGTPITVVNDGNTTSSGTNTQSQSAKIVTSTIPNPYGKACFVRYKWSVDGTNFNTGIAHLLYSFTKTFTSIPVTSPPLPALRAAVSVGC